jgi:hypothetical protein
LTQVLPLGILGILVQNGVEIKIAIVWIMLYICNFEGMQATLFIGGIQERADEGFAF